MESRPLSPEAKAMAEALVKRYFAECFWFRHPEATIDTVGDGRIVAERLRSFGGRPGWDEAGRLMRCL